MREDKTFRIHFELGTAVDLYNYPNWNWYTANDADGRDPISFALYGSEDGNTWVLLDSASDASITNDRKVLAYTGDIDIGNITAETKKKYVKISGAWVEDTIGTYSAGENMELSDSTFNCTLPFKVVNGQLCIKYKKEVTS